MEILPTTALSEKVHLASKWRAETEIENGAPNSNRLTVPLDHGQAPVSDGEEPGVHVGRPEARGRLLEGDGLLPPRRRARLPRRGRGQQGLDGDAAAAGSRVRRGREGERERKSARFCLNRVP